MWSKSLDSLDMAVLTFLFLPPLCRSKNYWFKHQDYVSCILGGSKATSVYFSYWKQCFFNEKSPNGDAGVFQTQTITTKHFQEGADNHS